MWYVHAMEYYSASKKEENLTYAIIWYIIWLKLEGIMLSEINQTLKDYCMHTHIHIIQKQGNPAICKKMDRLSKHYAK